MATKYLKSPAKSSGFTLIELLTVIAIIGILAAIIIPTVGKVRSTARTAVMLSNLRQISPAFLSYAADNKGLLPCATHGGAGGDNPTKGFWYHELTPYMGGKLVLQADGTIASPRTAPASKFFNDPVWASLLGYDPVQTAIDQSWADIRIGYSMNNLLNFSIGQSASQFGSSGNWKLRQRLSKYTNPSRTVIVGMGLYEGFSVDATTGKNENAPFNADGSGASVNHFARIGADSSGNGGSKGGFGFLDGSVRAMTPDEAAVLLKRQ
jgi:prepilin-type N-terminal cleavage/methylation domain-containing protein